MENIADYTILQKIDETGHSLVYRAQKKNEAETFIIKAIKAENPSASEIARFKQEYELIKRIEIDGVIKVFDIIRHGDGFALVLEDFNGVSVKSVLNEKGKLDMLTFLNIAIPLSETLGLLHNEDITHKDIKPHNILINLETNNVKLTDFGISSILIHEDKKNYSDIIEGTLPYISPEQTGRMNRSIDYRTDLYSLGVTFYEMLTRKLPFKSNDPMEMIHAHIAITPAPPIRHSPDIPVVISDIIIKLLFKNAEERYQSCFGLMEDLKECMKQLKEKGRIEPFELFKNDISGKFTIPEKLYGREKEIESLISTLERVSKGTKEFTLITGPPGIGKSALISELHKPVVAQKGYFITGQYERLKKDEPYSGIIRAFQGLARQLLSESEERLKQWKINLLKALGPNGRVITDIIPEIALIIGQQPPLADIGPEQAKNRFNYIFETFITLFATKDHPLTLFLDDLQWIDIESLRLLERLSSSSEIKHLFLIGAFRDSDVSEIHPIIEWTKKNKPSDIHLTMIVIKPLAVKDIQHIVTDMFKPKEQNDVSLADAILNKTGGNPFFVIQFLHTLYNEKIFVFNPAQGWTWDVGRISNSRVTDNVVALMEQKIKKLPEDIHNTLKICACFGNRIDLETLAMLQKITIDQALSNLTKPVYDGLIGISKDICFFHHNRIQETMYSLIPDQEKSLLHYQIGKNLLYRMKKNTHPTRFFFIVDQLNLGVKLITQKKEKEELILLNFEAGKKAMASAAYTPAYTYLKNSMNLLEKNCWELQHDHSFSIYLETSKAAYLNGDFKEMERLVEVILNHVTTWEEKTKAYAILIQACKARNNYQGAIAMSLPILNELGFRLPEKPGKLKIAIELLKTKAILSGKTNETLLNLPIMTDPEKISVVRIIKRMIIASFIVNPELFTVIILKLIRFINKWGNTSLLVAYAPYGLLFSGVLGQIDSGYRFVNLDLKLSEQNNSSPNKETISYIFNVFIKYFKEPLRNTLPGFLKGYQACLENGEPEPSANNLYVYSIYAFFAGIEFLNLEPEMAKFNQALKNLNQKRALHIQGIYWQMVLNLMGKSKYQIRLSSSRFDEEKVMPYYIRENDTNTLYCYYTSKIVLAYLFNDISQALEHADMMEKYRKSTPTSLGHPITIFYDSLIRLDIYNNALKKEKKKIIRKVYSNQKKMKKWADHAPMNFLYKYYLVEAEIKRIRKDDSHAVTLYDHAIQLAHENHYINEEAIANELAAKFYLLRKKKKIAKTYMTDAYGCFSRWGATAKTTQLKKLYPELLLSSQEISYDKASTMTSTTSQSDVLDLSTVIKVSQAISGELVLENLLVKMMKIAMENAGAQKGFLIRQTDDQLFIEMATEISSDNTEMIRSMPLEHSRGLCKKVVHYVIRTGEDIVLHDAATHGEFSQDPYILENNVKSVLCIPFRYKDRIYGVFYLENNLVPHAFTKDRIELLKVLLTQSAISMENAELFEKSRLAEQELKQHRDHLEELVLERTKELENVHRELIKKAHQAGMATIATDTLHNVGNILTSVKTSASIIEDVTEKSQFEGLKKANGLLREHMDNIEDFIVNDPKGKKLLTYYLAIEEEVAHEQRVMLEHLIRLKNKIHDIEEVVDAQQTFVETDTFTESL